MASAVQETLAYVKGREAFGKPLMALQNTRFVLAECETALRVTRSFLDECIVLFECGELDAATASMVKWWSTDQQCKVVDACVQRLRSKIEDDAAAPLYVQTVRGFGYRFGPL